MQINLDDAIIYACEAVQQKVNTDTELRDYYENTNLSKITFADLLQSKFALDVISTFVSGAMYNYHNQLRQTLLSQGVEINEMDITATPLRNQDNGSNRDG